MLLLFLQVKSLFAVYRLRQDYTEAYRPLFNEASWAHNRPVLLDIVADMERLCPDALLLNYVNPMSMNQWAMSRASSIKTT